MLKSSVKGMAAALLVVLVAAICVRLGFWQLQRLEERRSRNAELSAALADPPIDLIGDTLDAVLEDPARYRYRRVRVHGTYDSGASLLLRGRARRGVPGVHLVVPLRLEGGDSLVLVDRGWLPAPDAATADPGPYESTDPVTVEGLLQPLEPARADPSPVTMQIGDAEVHTFQRLDPASLRPTPPAVLLPVYLQRIPSDDSPDALPLADPIPTLDEGPHLGYALQWFSFAAIAVIGFGIVVLRGRSRM